MTTCVSWVAIWLNQSEELAVHGTIWNQVATFNGVANIRDGHCCQPSLYRASITVHLVMEKPTSKTNPQRVFLKKCWMFPYKTENFRLRNPLQSDSGEALCRCGELRDRLRRFSSTCVSWHSSSNHVFQVVSNHHVADFLRIPTGNPTWR